jgi:mannosylglycoprotein endo-beta-mannosidase
VGNIKLKIAMANTLVLRFDVAQEARALSLEEAWLRKTLKHVVLGLASLERTIARQRSRLRWLKEGDANTKLFHAVANGRRTKNYIVVVRVGDETTTTHEKKNELFTEELERIMGSIQTRAHTIDLEALGIPVADLAELDNMFTEEEIWNTIREMPNDRAPGPDGFTSAFYQRAWPIIKHDILAGIMKLGV